MNAYDILYGLEYIDKDLTEKAVNYKRNSLIYLRAVAAACLILVFGVSAVLSGITIRNSVSIRESNLSKRFGMYPVDLRSENPFDLPSEDGQIMRPYDYFKRLTEADYISIIYGTAENISTVKTYKGDTTCYVTTFDINIINTIKNAPESGAVRVICANYKSDSALYPQTYCDVMNRPTAMFILMNDKINEENGVDDTVWLTDIKTFDYADYRLLEYCPTDESGTWLREGGEYLTFDDLREILNLEIQNEAEFDEKYWNYRKKNNDKAYIDK